MVPLDQSLAVAVEVLGRDAIVGRGEAVDAGQAGDQPHVAPCGLVEQLLGRDRRGGGERLAGRRAAGQQVVEEPPRRLAGVVAVGVLDLLGEDPVLQPGSSCSP